MGKRMKSWLDQWGYAAMCVLCAGVILCSALWTRNAQEEENLSQDAARSLDERLSDVIYQEESAQTAAFCRPCDGQIVRPYTEKAELFSLTGVWRTHPSVDLDAPQGTVICAMWAGTVQSVTKSSVTLSHGDKTSVYQGLAGVQCDVGQSLSAGDPLGTAGGYVPFEGAGHVCISVLDEQGDALDPAIFLSD